jgi:peptide/nickel transport system permease protein
VLLAIVVIATVGFVIVNLIVDLLYPLVDPRLRHRGRVGRAARKHLDPAPTAGTPATAGTAASGTGALTTGGDTASTGGRE